MTRRVAPTLETARRLPEHPALLCRGEVWTYGEFEACIQEAARRLRTLGVTAGTRVALWAGNSPDWAILAHAIGRAGGVLLPLNTRLTDHELGFQARHAEILLASPELALRARQALAPDLPVLTVDGAHPDLPEFWATAPDPAPVPEVLELDAPQAILFTSGTSGVPKGAVLTWANQFASADASASVIPLSPEDRWIDCMPLFHVGGLNILYRCALAGAVAILHERFDAEAVNLAFDRDGGTVISLVASTLTRTLDARKTPLPPYVRAVLIGGGPVPPDLVARCPIALPTYGMTETCSGVTLVAPGASDEDRATAGRPMAGVELEIRNADGKALPPGTPGTITVRGPMVIRSYLDSEATAKALREGWLDTGDYGVLDDAGRLTVLTRRNDLIISGGENVYPAEIEAALRAHPSVSEAAVLGIPHPRWGQAPLAFVVSRERLDLDSVRAFLAGRLARYKLPAVYRELEALPLLSNGKVDRRSLAMLAVAEIDAHPLA
ncbi:2-succinylbenzoate--CoA ligase [compost metagenome]